MKIRFNILKMVSLSLLIASIIYMHKPLLLVVLVFFYALPWIIKPTLHRGNFILFDRCICLLTSIAWAPLLWSGMEFLTPFGVLFWFYATWPKIIWLESIITSNKSVDSKSEFISANLFERGMSFYREKKYDMANKFWIQAAILGHLPSMHWLGIMYVDRSFFTRDLNMAIYWFRQAANRGYADSQYNLGELYIKYEKGLSFRSDAQFWLKKAVSQEHERAMVVLRKLEDNAGSMRDTNSLSKWYAANKVIRRIFFMVVGVLILSQLLLYGPNYLRNLREHPGYSYSDIMDLKENAMNNGHKTANQYLKQKGYRSQSWSGDSQTAHFDVPVIDANGKQIDTMETACGHISYYPDANKLESISAKYVWLSYNDQLWIENGEEKHDHKVAELRQKYCQYSL